MNMSLHIGIVGLPNVGKSTLFQAITQKQVDRANYPFCTIDPNIGVVAVPDERVDKLAELTHSQKRSTPPLNLLISPVWLREQARERVWVISF